MVGRKKKRREIGKDRKGVWDKKGREVFRKRLDRVKLGGEE